MFLEKLNKHCYNSIFSTTPFLWWQRNGVPKKPPPRHFVPKCQRRTNVDLVQYVRHPELVWLLLPKFLISCKMSGFSAWSQPTFPCHPEFISGSQSTLTEMLKQVQHDVTKASRVRFFAPTNNELPSHTRGGLGRGGLPVMKMLFR